MSPEEKKELLTELGELTYRRAWLQRELNINAQRSNEIATAIETQEKKKDETV